MDQALDAGPFGPWVARGDDGDAANFSDGERGLLAAGVLDVAVLYEALADARGLNPRQVDELFIWECAVLLKVHRPKTSDEPPVPAPVAGRQGPQDRYARLKARVAHSRGEGPKPEAESMTADTFARLTQALG